MTEADDTLEEARAHATRGVETFGLRPRPYRLGCALFVIATLWLASTFGIALAASVCAHRWGLS